MERKAFNTLIKADHKFAENEYVRGRIHGMKTVICDDEVKNFANMSLVDGIMFTSYCTDEQYDKFVTVVKESYPDLCIFNYIPQYKEK